MLEPFILRAAAAGAAAAAVAGALGCFVVWRRMAYFGDSVAHGALLGVALGLLGGFAPGIGALAVAAGFAALLARLRRARTLPDDALLGVLAHSALAWGVVAISLGGGGVDLHAYLFGDILFIGRNEALWIVCGAALALLALAAKWNALLLLAMHEDMAEAEGVSRGRADMLLLLLLALAVASSIRVFGVLLVAGLLVIPAATARALARSPAGAAFASASLGVAAVIIGLTCSLHFDTPAGPSIVAAASTMFVLSLLFASRRARG